MGHEEEPQEEREDRREPDGGGSADAAPPATEGAETEPVGDAAPVKADASESDADGDAATEAAATESGTGDAASAAGGGAVAKKKKSFGDDALEKFKALTSRDSTGEKLKRLELIHRTSRKLHNTVDVDSLLPQVLKATVDAVGAEAGSLWLLKGKSLVCDQAIGGAADKIVGMELPKGAGVVGSVADRRRPEIVLDVEKDARHLHQVDEATGFVARSMITVPLLVAGQSLGALQVINKIEEGQKFTKTDAVVVQEIALDAAMAIRNARLVRTERRAREMRALLRMSREITSTLDLDRILATAANILSGIVAYDRCIVALDRGGELQAAAVSGQETIETDDPLLKADMEFIRWLAPFQVSIYGASPDRADDEDDDEEAADGVSPRKLAERMQRHAEATGMRSLLAIPLTDESGSIGLFFMEAEREEFLEEGQQELVETFANQVAVALRNADLYSQTPMVGLRSFGGSGSRLGQKQGDRWTDRRGVRIAGAVVLLLVIAAFIPWNRSASGTAEVTPARRFHLRPEVTLAVETIEVEEGERVSAGQRLGTLHDDELVLSRAELDSDIRSGLLEQANAESAGRPAEAAAARERVRFLRAQGEQIDRRIAACELIAPVDGYLLTRRPRDLVGTNASAGETLLEIAQEGRWVVEVKVRQEDIVGLDVDAEVDFLTPALPGRTFAGHVVAIGVTGERTGDLTEFPVTAEIDDPEGVLRSGMQGRGHVDLGDGSLLGRLLGGVWRWLRWTVGF